MLESKAKIMRHCIVCGKPFLAKNVNSVHCSKKCSDETYRNKRRAEKRERERKAIVDNIEDKDFLIVVQAQALEFAQLLLRRYSYDITFVGKLDIPTPPFWIDMSKMSELYVFHHLHHLLRHAPQVQNQGYMQESVRLATQYICDAKLTNELYTEVDVNNIASQKVLERCGYKVKEEQTLRFLYCYQNYNIELQTS